MAPLPMFHRPLSMDSRDTSASNSSGRPVDTSAESGSGFSLPMRNQSVPDSPSTINGTLGSSSDYLVPTAKGLNNNHPAKGSSSSRKPESPTLSDHENAVQAESEPMIRGIGRNGVPLELETSFSTPNGQFKSPRRSDGYSSLPQSEAPLPPSSSLSSSSGRHHQPPYNGRISNMAYGLTSGVSGSSSRPSFNQRLSGSKSTQPLLEHEHTPSLSPENPYPPSTSSVISLGRPMYSSPTVAAVAASPGGGDLLAADDVDDGCPTGPLPPTPTDQPPSAAETPSSNNSLPLDVNSLRSHGNLPAPRNYMGPGSGGGESGGSGSGGPGSGEGHSPLNGAAPPFTIHSNAPRNGGAGGSRTLLGSEDPAGNEISV